MILRLLEHVNGNKQPTNNTTVLTLSRKLLLFHDEIARANNAVSSIALPLLHCYCRALLPWLGPGCFPVESHVTQQVSHRQKQRRKIIHGQITFFDLGLTKLLIQDIATLTNQASQMDEWLQYTLNGLDFQGDWDAYS